MQPIEYKSIASQLSSSSRNTLLEIVNRITNTQDINSFRTTLLESITEHMSVAFASFMEVTGDFTVISYETNSPMRDRIGKNNYENTLSSGTEWARSLMGPGHLPYFEIGAAMRFSKLPNQKNLKESEMNTSIKEHEGDFHKSYFMLVGMNPALRNGAVLSSKQGSDFTKEEITLQAAIAEFAARQYRQLIKTETLQNTVLALKSRESNDANLALLSVTENDLTVVNISDEALDILTDHRNPEDTAVYNLSDDLAKIVNSWKKEKTDIKEKISHTTQNGKNFLLTLWQSNGSQTIEILFEEVNPHWSDSLSKRQVEVMLLVGKGLTNGEIAQELGISQRTVEKHCAMIYEQLNLNSRWDAIHLVISQG